MQICTDASKHPSKGSTKSFSADALMKQLVKYGEMAQVSPQLLETSWVASRRLLEQPFTVGQLGDANV